MRQWEHGGIPCAPDLFLLPTPGSRPPAAGDICLSSPHEAGGGTKRTVRIRINGRGLERRERGSIPRECDAGNNLYLSLVRQRPRRPAG